MASFLTKEKIPLVGNRYYSGQVLTDESISNNYGEFTEGGMLIKSDLKFDPLWDGF